MGELSTNMPGIIILIFIVYFLLIFGAIHLITRKARARRKNEEAELPEWRRKPLTKAQQPIVREQYIAYKAEVYRNYPEAARFEKNRRGWTVFILLFYLVTAIMRGCARLTLGVYGNVGIVPMIIGVLAGYLIGASLVFVSIERSKITVLLYVIGLAQLVSYMWSFSKAGIDTWEMFVQTNISGFQYYPLSVMANILSIIYSLLLLLTAVWLTAIKRNRKLAEQVDTLNERIKKEFKPTGI